jgi:aryl-alcohol dehydrogenase-like predicted oxidoreductase
MRYRPFARVGMAVSALSLSLDATDDTWAAGDWRDLLHAAFELGINSFELMRPSAALLRGLADGVSAVPRHLLFFGLRIEPAENEIHLAREVCRLIDETGLRHLDLLSLQATPGLSAGPSPAMRALKDEAKVRGLGIAGDCDLLTTHLKSGGFDALVTSFNLLSGWRERHMVRGAMEKQVAVIGCDPWPAQAESLAEAAAKPKAGWFSKPQPLAGVGSYSFLAQTQGWSAEQLCLGYALTEPALASVQVKVGDADHLAALSEITERDLPPAISAQIEMARFSAERASGVERRARRRSA